MAAIRRLKSPLNYAQRARIKASSLYTIKGLHGLVECTSTDAEAKMQGFNVYTLTLQLIGSCAWLHCTTCTVYNLVVAILVVYREALNLVFVWVAIAS